MTALKFYASAVVKHGKSGADRLSPKFMLPTQSVTPSDDGLELDEENNSRCASLI